jgi:hypothetical protein
VATFRPGGGVWGGDNHTGWKGWNPRWNALFGSWKAVGKSVGKVVGRQAATMDEGNLRKINLARTARQTSLTDRSFTGFRKKNSTRWEFLN